MLQCVHRSEDTLQWLVYSFHHVGLERNSVHRAWQQCFYLISHLTGPRSVVETLLDHEDIHLRMES